MIPLVDLKRQYSSIKDEIDQTISRVLESTSFINGPSVRKFELGFARTSCALFAVGTSSGTTALHVALVALGIGPGDEVITTPNTFIATTEAITQTGAKVRFVDIDEATYNMDVDLLKETITDKTKAIVPVCLYGQPCDIEGILQLAQKLDIKVVIDAAQAHGAQYKDKGLGAYGDAVVYSFYPGKNLGAYGDAGMVTTNDEALADKMRMLVNHGRSKKYEHAFEGYNYRIDEIQAACLYVKLNYLADWTQKRQQAAKLYTELLSDSDVVLPTIKEDRTHVFHLFVVRLQNRDAMQEALKAEGIATGIHYPIPLHLQPAYQYLQYNEGDFPVAERCSKEILSLPMFPELTQDEVKHIASTLKLNVNQHSPVELQHV